MSRRLRAVVGGSCMVASLLVLGAMPAGAQAGEADLLAGTPVVSPPPVAGGTSTYVIGITNGGPDATTNVRIQTNFNMSGDDSWVTLGSASVTGGSCNLAGPRVAVCNVPNLGVGETASVAVTFSLSEAATGTITVNGRVTSDLLDPDPDNFTTTGPLQVSPPPTTSAPPTTAAPPPPPAPTQPTVPVVTELPQPRLQPVRPQPAVAPVPQVTTASQLPTTGPTSPVVVWVGVGGLVLGGALVVAGRSRASRA